MNEEQPFPRVGLQKPTRRRSAISWQYVLEGIYPFPSGLKRLLRCKILFSLLNLPDQIYIISHMYLNHVHPQYIVDALWLNNNCTLAKVKMFINFFKSLWGNSRAINERRSAYYAFNIILGRISDLNGHVSAREKSLYANYE